MAHISVIFGRHAPGYDAERRRLIPLGEDATYVTGDLASPLPAGPWDAIVSALAIHHLEDDGKRDLFARAHDALGDGGVFVNAEQVSGPTALLGDADCLFKDHCFAVLVARR